MNYKKIADEIKSGQEIIFLEDFENTTKARYDDEVTLKESKDINDLLIHTLQIFWTEEEIERQADRIDWFLLLKLPGFPTEFSDSFFEKFGNDIPWEVLAESGKLSKEFLIKNAKFFDFSKWYVLEFKFSEEELRKLEPSIKDLTPFLVNNRDISEKFLRDFKNKIRLRSIHYSLYKDLSLSFFEDFTDEIEWESVHRIRLTEEFMDKFGHLLNWNSVLHSHILSDRLISKYQEHIIADTKKRMQQNKSNFLKYLEETTRMNMAPVLQEAHIYHAAQAPQIN